jgi:uncharacterized protein involved in exopolysaccharide biosynthesis
MAREDQIDSYEAQISLLDLLRDVLGRWKLILLGSSAAGAVAVAITYAIPPTYTARLSFLPPQQQQSGAVSALASLGSLGSLAGVASGIRIPSDQYASLLQSVTVMDALVEKFDLMKVYGEDYRVDARTQLERRVRVGVGKRDGIIVLEVDDGDPTRAASIANAHVQELGRLTSKLALTEAQHRRTFFESQLKETRVRLERAQSDLQASGFGPGALRAEPKAAADSYARLRAELTSAEVRLQSLRRVLADSAPEVLQAQSVQASLREQLARAESAMPSQGEPGYIAKYREFKYQETLFEMYARQFELARLDESKEGTLVQVVDPATPPEKRSKPKRRVVLLLAVLGTALSLILFVIGRALWTRSLTESADSARMSRLRRGELGSR